MLVIASNITTRNAGVARIFRKRKIHAIVDPDSELRDLAKRCAAAGADIIEINLQQHYDRPELMEFAVNAAQQVTDRQLCLSSNNAETIEAGLRLCKHAPLINYVTIETTRLQSVLPLVARYGAQVLLLISAPAVSADAEEMMKKAAILVGAANEVGIPNNDILIDPGLFHITHDIGQRHLTRVMEFLRAIPEAFDPPIKSTCWIANSSVGAPQRLRPVIETGLLAMLAGIGLSSVFLDVLKPANMRMVRLLKILNNEVIYSDSDLELR